LNFD
jgi:Ca2+-binding EF-hand superfamily protein